MAGGISKKMAAAKSGIERRFRLKLSAFAPGDAHLHVFLLGDFVVLFGIVVQVFGNPEIFPIAPNHFFHWIADSSRFFHGTITISITCAISNQFEIECHINTMGRSSWTGGNRIWEVWDTMLRNILPTTDRPLPTAVVLAERWRSASDQAEPYYSNSQITVIPVRKKRM